MHYQRNLLLSTDSYKLSHFLQYPPEVTRMFSYIEARRNNSGLPDIGGTVFFGLQAWIKEYLLKPITVAQVEEAADIAKATGVPFPKVSFMKVCQEHAGNTQGFFRSRSVP